MTGSEVEEEMICGLTADEREVLQRELDDLPQAMPPRAVWERIREQAEAEGLLRQSTGRRMRTWIGGAGLAASVVLAVLVLPSLDFSPPPARTEPLPSSQTNQLPLTALQALMVQSRQLESDLRSLPEEPSVVRASTVASLSEIEDRIAAIDFQLSDAGLQMTQEEKELFWRERVRLMQLLVQLRYAQAQRIAY